MSFQILDVMVSDLNDPVLGKAVCPARSRSTTYSVGQDQDMCV